MPLRRPGQAIRRSGDLWRKIGEPGPGAHARGYVRFSHEAGHYGLTVPGQRAQLQAYADERQWILDAFDVEPARSAKYDEIEKRPIFRAHLDAMEAGAAQVSLVYMNDRWARNAGVAYNSLSRLRQAGVFWATTDGRWNIDRINEDGFDIAYAVDVAMNAAYSRKVSEKTRIGKQTRAELGYHNGDVPFGYLRPPDPPRPLDAPTSWKPPRQPLTRHPVNFDRLVQIGQWAAVGLSDREIANRCNAAGWRSQPSKAMGPRRHYLGTAPTGDDLLGREVEGSRPFAKDSIRTILGGLLPREFAPGSGHGTILTPSGERIEGKHPAAWDWELCQRIDDARGLRARGGSTGRLGEHVWVFSGLAVCAACGHRLRAQGTPGPHSHGHRCAYACVALARGLMCPNTGWRSMQEDLLTDAFVTLLRQQPLPTDWRQVIVERANRLPSAAEQDSLAARRAELVRERERLLFQHQNGLIDNRRLLHETERIRAALEGLGGADGPGISESSSSPALQIEAGETLANLPAYWHAATPDERRELVHLLLVPEGLRVDLHHKRIVGLRPRPVYRVAFSLLLHDWEEDSAGWLTPRTLPSTPPPRQRHIAS